jgi:hypothetical protein
MLELRLLLRKRGVGRRTRKAKARGLVVGASLELAGGKGVQVISFMVGVHRVS